MPLTATADVVEGGDFQELTDITCEYPNPDDRYEGLGYVELQGFRVYIDYCSNSQYNEETIFHLSRAILLIDTQLKVAGAVLPQFAMAKLRSGINVVLLDYCDARGRPPGQSHAIYATSGNQPRIVMYCFEYWSEIYRNNFIDAPTRETPGRIRFTITSENSQRATMLHELAHAWHDLFVPDGFSNQYIASSYEIAKQCEYQRDDHYWRRNDREYFAEMSVAYIFQLNEEPYLRFYMDSTSKGLIKALWRENLDERATWPVAGGCSRSPRLVKETDS